MLTLLASCTPSMGEDVQYLLDTQLLCDLGQIIWSHTAPQVPTYTMTIESKNPPLGLFVRNESMCEQSEKRLGHGRTSLTPGAEQEHWNQMGTLESDCTHCQPISQGEPFGRCNFLFLILKIGKDGVI